jgi:hypothetical protein
VTKQILLLSLISLTTILWGQTNSKKDNKKLLTEKYSGNYSYGDNAEKGSVGSVIVFPETDSTILFFIDVCRGAPSYNLGQLYSRIKIQNGQGIYYNKSDYYNCKWQITLVDKTLTIKTLDNCYKCSFGGNVIADGIYKRKNKSKPKFFIDGHGHKIFFSKTSPENYHR